MEEEGRAHLDRLVSQTSQGDEAGSLFIVWCRGQSCHYRSGDMGATQVQVDTGDLSGMGSRKRGRNGSASSASRRHIQTEQKRRDKINEG